MRFFQLLPLLPGVQATLQDLLVLCVWIKSIWRTLWALVHWSVCVGGHHREFVTEWSWIKFCSLTHVGVTLVVLADEIQGVPDKTISRWWKGHMLIMLSAEQRLTLHPTSLLLVVRQVFWTTWRRLHERPCIAFWFDKLLVDSNVGHFRWCTPTSFLNPFWVFGSFKFNFPTFLFLLSAAHFICWLITVIYELHIFSDFECLFRSRYR